MALLEISNDLKMGKQEILIGAEGTPNANKCGSEVEPLYANDLNILLSDGTVVPLKDYIIQQAITISNLIVTVINGNDVQLTWTGQTDTEITVGALSQSHIGTGLNTYTMQNVPVGSHEVLVRGVGDIRGLIATVVIELPQGGGGINIVYGGN